MSIFIRDSAVRENPLDVHDYYNYVSSLSGGNLPAAISENSKTTGIVYCWHGFYCFYFYERSDGTKVISGRYRDDSNGFWGSINSPNWSVLSQYSDFEKFYVFSDYGAISGQSPSSTGHSLIWLMAIRENAPDPSEYSGGSLTGKQYVNAYKFFKIVHKGFISNFVANCTHREHLRIIFKRINRIFWIFMINPRSSVIVSIHIYPWIYYFFRLCVKYT